MSFIRLLKTHIVLIVISLLIPFSVTATQSQNIYLRDLNGSNDIYEFQENLGKGAFSTALLVKSSAQGNHPQVLLISNNQLNGAPTEQTSSENNIEFLLKDLNKNITSKDTPVIKFFGKKKFEFINSSRKEVSALVLEYANGGTLLQQLHKRSLIAEAAKYPKARSLRIKKALNLTLDLIEALSILSTTKLSPETIKNSFDFADRDPSTAYEEINRGIIHQDIKPANILFSIDDDGNERAKLADFGMATTRGAIPLNHASGTPFYISPEHIKFDRHLVNCLSDVYGSAMSVFVSIRGEAAHPYEAFNQEHHIFNKSFKNFTKDDLEKFLSLLFSEKNSIIWENWVKKQLEKIKTSFGSSPTPWSLEDQSRFKVIEDFIRAGTKISTQSRASALSNSLGHFLEINKYGEIIMLKTRSVPSIAPQSRLARVCSGARSLILKMFVP